MTDNTAKVHETVKEYYSEVTKKRGGELASSVCSCASSSIPDEVKKIVSDLPDEIVAKYYGCGSPIPDNIKGCTVLDLGCGTGRDVYVISKLVGAEGKVIGVDMNEDQLEVAERYKAQMEEKWGYSNATFLQGYIEDLASLGIEDGSIDVVISNCVINLSPDKQSVFSEVRRVLREGGVLYFSDMFADRKVTEEINTHPLLLGECLGGALSNDEFKEIMKANGWDDYTVVNSTESPINNPEIEQLIGDIHYYSNTIRAVKGKESCCCKIATVHESPCCCG